ncbi:Cell division control protein 48-like C, partial [Mucuna pruriens]
MGKRKGGSMQETLLRRLESCKSTYSTVEEFVSHLRSTYLDYQRIKHQTLIRLVQEALQDTKKPNHCDDDDHEGDSRTASPKRRKKIDESEERLQRTEELYVPRSAQSGSPAPSSASESDREVTVSTLEDAIYEERMEPEFDLIKTMLRNTYTQKKVAVAEEKNVELEVGRSRSSTAVAKQERKEVRASVSGDEVNEKAGPMFRDFGGMKKVLEELKIEVLMPLLYPQVPKKFGMWPIAGILLYGPPGCGKTRLARAIANESARPFYEISATEVVSGVSGESEENIRELFSKAYKTAPSIVFIDEIDAIASKRENLQREMDKRIVTQLMTCTDQSKMPGHVLVIGATNRPDAIDPGLRRSGRFDREIFIGYPDESAREEILFVLICNFTNMSLFDLRKLARATPGFVGADLVALVKKAVNLAIKRIIDERKSKLSQKGMSDEHAEDVWREPWSSEEMDKLAIKMSDFEEAVKLVQPSSRREGFSSIPNVKWEDVGGLDHLRQEFERYIVKRIKCPEVYERVRWRLETGFLLYGPPGCGKTLIAKAVATEAGASFIHIKGPELLNKYVGESELAVRTLFSRARTCAPCILFFDEVDALTNNHYKEGGSVNEGLLRQMVQSNEGVPEVMDPAVLRPGRFGKLVYVPLPSADQRVLILKTLAREMSIDASVDLSAIGKKEACESFSGADLAALMDEATAAALEENSNSTDGAWTIKINHFEVALSKIHPSVSDRQKQHYQHFSESFKAA